MTIEDKFMDTIIVHTQKGRLEERLGAAELVLAHSDDLAVRHFSRTKDAAAGMPYWKSRAKWHNFLILDQFPAWL